MVGTHGCEAAASGTAVDGGGKEDMAAVDDSGERGGEGQRWRDGWERREREPLIRPAVQVVQRAVASAVQPGSTTPECTTVNRHSAYADETDGSSKTKKPVREVIDMWAHETQLD